VGLGHMVAGESGQNPLVLQVESRERKEERGIGVL
jgi:hypothetical protein